MRQLFPVGERVGVLAVPERADQAPQEERLLEELAPAEAPRDAPRGLRRQPHLRAQALARADHVAPRGGEPVGDGPDRVEYEAFVVARFRRR